MKAGLLFALALAVTLVVAQQPESIPLPADPKTLGALKFVLNNCDKMDHTPGSTVLSKLFSADSRPDGNPNSAEYDFDFSVLYKGSEYDYFSNVWGFANGTYQMIACASIEGSSNFVKTES